MCLLAGSAPRIQRKFCVELTPPDEVLRQALPWKRGVNNQKKLVKFTLGKGDTDLTIRTSDRSTSALNPTSTLAVKTEPVAVVRSQSPSSTFSEGAVHGFQRTSS